jgi:hypothetical protein
MEILSNDILSELAKAFGTLFNAFYIIGLSGSLFLAVLFLQSGIDKVTDWKGNLGWLQGHFAETFLKGMVTPMLATVTVVELAAGLLSAYGIIHFFVAESFQFCLYGGYASALAIIMLFTGQRIAKDYAGAATLASYFGVIVLLNILFALCNTVLGV